MDDMLKLVKSILLEEADKCIILCHNCHAETHYPHFDGWYDL